MCLILLVWHVHPQYPCVLAANRDEFHGRATAAAAWWPDQPDLLAGRDLQAGGTWLGVTRAGRFAALTNYRDPRLARDGVPSRGNLVTQFLESRQSVAASLEHLRRVGAAYNPFNIIFSDGKQLGVFESVRGEGRELSAGVYGLSNHLLDTPWPKVRIAKSRMTDALTRLDDENAIMSLLRDDSQAPDEELPQTGITLEWERLVSSAFVRAGDYGTRCSTLFRIDRSGRAAFDEWSWDRDGRESGRKNFQFPLSAA
jgi:uncharacterized protein with NRDE domain